MPFTQCFGNCLSCICSRESLIFPAPACRESSASRQSHYGMAGEHGFPGLCPLLSQRSWLPLRFTATLYLKFSSIPCGGHLCFLHRSTEDPSTLLREGNAWRRKRRSNWFSPGGNLDLTPSLVLVGRDQPSRECRKESRELVFWDGNNRFL